MTAEQGINTGKLPIADRSMLIGDIVPLCPMPKGGCGGREHVNVFFRRPIRFVDQLPGQVERARGKLAMGKLHVERMRLVHNDQANRWEGEGIKSFYCSPSDSPATI